MSHHTQQSSASAQCGNERTHHMDTLNLVHDISEGNLTFVELSERISQYVINTGIETVPTRIEIDGYRILPGMAMAQGTVKNVQTITDEWGLCIRATSTDGISVEWQIVLSPMAVPMG
jgi:heterodisulfide reductase subunit C